MKEKYKEEDIIDIDGVKIEFKDRWVHLVNQIQSLLYNLYRAPSIEEATELGEKIISEIKDCWIV